MSFAYTAIFRSREFFTAAITAEGEGFSINRNLKFYTQEWY